MNTLYKTYSEIVVPKLKEELGIANSMAVPKLVKIVINCGLGEALKDKKVVDSVSAQLSAITGAKPQITRAKQAISAFKLRAGDIVGIRVTLRGARMYDFFMKLVGIALPRVRDFRGVPQKGFDRGGNYTLGLREQTIFPELEYKLVDKIRGFEITFVSTARDVEEGKALLTALGMPFEKGN
jgi:large subunit ribosomal protein L5